MVAAMQICGHGGKLSVHGGVRNAAHEGASCESLLRYCALPMVASGFLVWSEVGNICATAWLAGISGAQRWVPLNHRTSTEWQLVSGLHCGSNFTVAQRTAGLLCSTGTHLAVVFAGCIT